MAAYQTQVVAVEAVQWDGTEAGAATLVEELAIPFHTISEVTQGKVRFQVPTPAGMMNVTSGDYVVQHADGTYSVVGSAIFDATYEAAV